MRTYIKTALIALSALGLNACYDSFTSDYDYSTVCFAVQNPVRYVIADRDMEIYVGVAIGGKREVDMSDWAKFSIQPSLLDGTNFTLLPESYYELADPDTFRVRKSNSPAADVAITFTEAFYQDPNSVNLFYALPLVIESSSLDVVNEGMEYSIVAIRYISTYHGTYYVKGSVTELDAPGGTPVDATVTYAESDLSRNFTRDFSTLSRRTVSRPGLANFVLGDNERAAVVLTVSPTANNDGTWNVTVEDNSGTVVISNATGKYTPGDRPQFDVSFECTRTIPATGAVHYYKVDETYILRQDPLYDLRLETW